jgi:hypothetical protein
MTALSCCDYMMRGGKNMASTHVEVAAAEWTSGQPFYGPGAVYDGKDIVQLKVLSDRRAEGGGIAWLARFSPPTGKLVKIASATQRQLGLAGLRMGRRAHRRSRGAP